MVGEEEDVRERFRAVEKGSRAAGKVLRTGKEPCGVVKNSSEGLRMVMSGSDWL